MATWGSSGVEPDWRDEDPRYDRPTPADDGFDWEFETHMIRKFYRGLDEGHRAQLGGER